MRGPVEGGGAGAGEYEAGFGGPEVELRCGIDGPAQQVRPWCYLVGWLIVYN